MGTLVGIITRNASIVGIGDGWFIWQMEESLQKKKNLKRKNVKEIQL